MLTLESNSKTACSIGVRPAFTSTMITPADIIAGPGVVGRGPDEYGPRYIGAREYASGDGDSAVIEVGEFGTLELTPRECYGNVAPGLKFEEKVIFEILSDETGSAKFLDYEDESGDSERYISDGNSVYARITSDSIGTLLLGGVDIIERSLAAIKLY